MGGDKIGPGHAIAVKKDAQRALAGTNAAIANLTAAKPAMLVTDMLEWNREARLPVFDQSRGLGSRAIVSNDDFEIAIRLRGKRAQRSVQRVLAIVGCDDNRNEKRAAHDCSPPRIEEMLGMPFSPRPAHSPGAPA